MRITFLVPPVSLHGGVRVIVSYAEALQARGHTVLCVAPSHRWRPRFLGRVKSVALGRGWPRAGADARPPSHFDGSAVPLKVLETQRPIADADLPDADVVVATWWETAEWAARLSPAKGARAYFIQQYEVNFDQPADRVDATWRLPMQKICISRWLTDMARDRFGDPDALTVPPGLDLDLFNAPPRGKQDRPTVGVLFSTQSPKCWPVALATFIAARRRVPELRVRAFGAVEPTSSYPLPEDCEFTLRPPQHAIREIYASCDVWLCPSSSEGFHLPPQEAMACRCPVVSTRVGGPVDMIEDGVHGYLVDRFDACALADRLAEVAALPPEDWRAMSDRAYAQARRDAWALDVDTFERGLSLALERSGRAAPASMPQR